MRTFTAALLLASLAACGGGDAPPDVNWPQVPAYQRAGIQGAVESGDCGRMQAVFDGSERADVLAYLNWYMQDAGCY